MVLQTANSSVIHEVLEYEDVAAAGP
jgi:hypothetical protein